jgi:hypothetical protein
MHPRAITPEKRAAILKDIKAVPKTGKSRNQIARDRGVSMSTVTKIAGKSGHGDAFDRTRTAAATRAVVIDSRARREQLRNDLLDDAQRLRERAWSSHEAYISTPQGAERVVLELPPLQDTRAAFNAIGICIDKSLRLEQFDTDDSGASAVDEWVRSLIGESR